MSIYFKLFPLEKTKTAGVLLMIGLEEIKSEDQVKLVGILIDNKLSYD